MPPMISVLTAVHDPERDHLEACLASVAAQTIDDWEHIIVDDGSTESHVADILRLAAADRRVTVISRPESGGIVAASSDALARARGEFVALLDHDDVLEPDALALMLEALVGGADLAYSDHDILSPEGHTTRPYLKPDYSPEQLRNQNYMLHFVAARRSVVEAVGGFRPGFDGAQDHDLLLRMLEQTDRVAHVPHVLYHWRQARTSVAANPAAKPWAYDAGLRAVQEHCDRTGIDAVVEPGVVAGAYRLRRRLNAPPRVSIIIPTRGSSRRVWGVTRCFVAEAVRSLVESSTYPDLEFVVVYDRETPTSVLRYLEAIAGDRLTLVEYAKPFNFSDKMNVGAEAATGELLLLLNDDTELIASDSIETMAAHLLDDSVGMVGPKLLFADGTLQDAGHVYTEHVLPGLVGWHGTSPGPGQLRPLAVEREVAGVTAAAAMVRHTVYDEVGGFDPVLWMNFNDVDFSLKIRRSGRRVIWTPFASWHHFESQTRPPSAEPEEFVEIDRRWHDEINRDPYYNPNFVPRRTDWLERPWHSGYPPLDDVDTTASHRSWLWQRIRETSWGNQLLSTQGRAVISSFVLVLAAWIVSSESGAAPGFIRRVAFTLVPIVLWIGLTSVALFRSRRVLASAMLVGVSPSILGLLAAASAATATWIVAVIVAVFVGPLWRRHRAAPVAALLAFLTTAAIVDRSIDTSRVAGRGVTWYVRDSVMIANAASESVAWLTVVLWWTALVCLAGFVWIAGHRMGAISIVAAPPVAAIVLGLVPALATGDARTAAWCAAVGVAIAAAARVDQGRRGSRLLLDVVSGAVVASWVLAAIDVVAA